MASDDPKNQGTDSKIKFFKLETDGEIAPAFPSDPVQTSSTEKSLVDLESLQEPLVDGDLPPLSELSGEYGAELEAQINSLDPSVGQSIEEPSSPSAPHPAAAAHSHGEVEDLKEQIRQYQAFVKKAAQQLEESIAKSKALAADLEGEKVREEALKAEISDLKSRYQDDLIRLKNDYEEKLQRYPGIEAQAHEWERRRTEWQAKIKEDVRKIKLKERELENKHEILRRDMQALLDSKDKHIMELKKKNDALELDLEALEERVREGNATVASIVSKKTRLIETLKLAVALLEDLEQTPTDAENADDGVKRKAG